MQHYHKKGYVKNLFYIYVKTLLHLSEFKNNEFKTLSYGDIQHVHEIFHEAWGE